MEALDVFLGIYGVTKVIADGPAAHLLDVPVLVNVDDDHKALIVPPGQEPVETLLHARRSLTPHAAGALDQAVKQMDDAIAESSGDQAAVYAIIRRLVIRTGDPRGVADQVLALIGGPQDGPAR
ncbi:hypothetical protein ACFY97_13140 [Streptomyces klenkii]|uniref:hypothetical protein n=1 Tax=Streptomyces klenkii TaxID=1420899 RepID=UPI0036E3E4CC